VPHRSLRVCVSCAVLALLAPAVWAAEAQTSAEAEKAAKVFESLFGADAARVAKTRDARDDIDLAKRLLDTARGDAAGNPALVAVLCEKAFDLASGHADGYATAVAAAEFLASQVPAKAGECAERLVTVRQKQYALAARDAKAAAAEALVDALLGAADAKSAAGDPAGAVSLCRRAEGIARAVKSDRLADVAARREHLAHRLTVHREIANMKALVARDSGNTAAREKLVRLYLVDLDDPAAAAKHLEGAEDESLKKYVPAAGKGVEAAPELASNQLGDWYRGLGEGAQGGAKAAMFARAKAYYDRFLSLHKADDLDRTAATVALKKVEAELAELAPAAAAPSTGKPTPVGTAAVPKDGVIKPGAWVDLLTLIDLHRDRVSGEWQKTGVSLAKTKPEPRSKIIVPVAPRGSYELAFAFVRQGGAGSVDAILPVGDTQVLYSLGAWDNTLHCLQLVEGKGGDTNPTSVRGMPLEQGRRYDALVRLRHSGARVSIQAYLDGRLLTQWSGPVTGLSIRPEWAIPDSNRLGLMVNNLQATLLTMRLRMLSGEARLLRPLGGTGAKPTVSATAAATPLPKADAKGWVPLLAGGDLSLWSDATGAEPGPGWVAQGGVLMRTAKAGDIWTRHRFDDFVLDLEFITEGNSGIFIRTGALKDHLRAGLEIQIIGPSGAPSKTSCGAVYGCQAPKADVVRAGGWNRMAIAASGNRIAVDLNGTRIIEMDLARWTTPGRNPDGSLNKRKAALKDMTGAGHIGLQDHGSNIMFRNIRIKPLGK